LYFRLAIRPSRFDPDRLFYYPGQAPALGFAAGPALSNFNRVADASLAVLVMNTKFSSTPYVFIVLRMPDLEVDGNFDALVAAIADYNTGHSFGFSILHIRFPVTNRSP